MEFSVVTPAGDVVVAMGLLFSIVRYRGTYKGSLSVRATSQSRRRNFPAIYSQQLEVSIGIHMRGPMLRNSIKAAIPAHVWPFKIDENCDALTLSYPFFSDLILGQKSPVPYEQGHRRQGG